MNVKKLLLLFVTLMVLLVGVASATDISDDSIICANMAEAAEQETHTATDMDIIATQDNKEKEVERDTSPENDVTATQSIQKKTNKDNTKEATSVTTWDELKQTITCATGDTTIILQGNMINAETIILYNENIVITIDGNGQTINGNQKQVFHIYGSTLILKNITITNAQTTVTGENVEANGGAIYNNDGNLVITNSTLQNNTATATATGQNSFTYGGAIYNNGGSLTITNSTIQNNTATATGQNSYAEGGAIYNNGGSLTITNSTIQNNTATATGQNSYAEGGAICNHGGSLTITNSTIQNNTATATGQNSYAYGGAIYNYGTLTITESTIQNNTATATATGEYSYAYGGVIYNKGTLTIASSTLQNNTVTGEDAEVRGGAIYNWNGNYIITDTIFYKNTSENFIITENKIQLMEEPGSFISIGEFIIITDCGVIGTGTSKDGLAQFTIEDEYENVVIVISGTDDRTLNNRYIIRGFDNFNELPNFNKVHNYTELVNAIEKAQSENYNSYIINLLPGDYNATKSITWEESETKNLIINGNYITLDGKNKHQFIRIGPGLNLTLNHITITNYQTTATGEQAYAHGGAIYNNNGNITITNSTIQNNTATATGQQSNAEGGAIYNNNGNITITNSTIQNNTLTATEQQSNAEGGAIYNLYGTLTITNSTIQNNTATATEGFVYPNGGAIYNNNGNITITNSTIQNNTATATGQSCYAWGGAIFNYGTLTITNSTIQNNTATATATGEHSYAYGGAIINYWGTLTIASSTLQNNTVTGEDAEVRGGAIYNWNGNYNTTDTTFYKNTPENFIITENKIQLIEEPGSFISIGEFIIITDCGVIGTGTSKDGLAQFTIEDEYENVVIVISGTDDRTLNNRYIIRGFDIFNEVHNYTELVNAIEKAQSENYNRYIINLLPGDYNATKNITWEESETKNLIINGNGLTLNGNGLYQFIKVGTGLNLTLTNITITNYKADYGGAINNHGTLTITESTLTNNTATENGGAVYNCEYEYFNIINSNMTKNHAVAGGAIYCTDDGINSTIKNNRFIQNTADNKETLVLHGEKTIENNTYDYTDISIKTLNLTIKDNQEIFILDDDVILNFTIKLENPNYYDEDITEKIDKTIYINDVEKITTKNLTYTLSQLKTGEYTIYFTACYHESNRATYKVYVNTTLFLNPVTTAKYNTNLTISGRLFDEENLGLPNQNITLTIDDKKVNLTTTNNGLFNYTTTFKSIGEQIINAKYEGTDKYKSSNTTQTITVNKKESKVTVNNIASVTCNDNVTITGMITDIDDNPLGHVNVFIYLNGEEQHVTTYRTGIFKATFTTTTVGQQEVLVKYKGNTKYLGSNATTTFTTSGMKLVMFKVKPVTYRDTYTIQGKLTDHEGKVVTGAEVQLTINGETILLTTDKNGKYTYKAQALKTGNLTATATYKGEETYNQQSVSKTLVVTKRTTTLIVNEIPNTIIGSQVTITGKLTDDIGTAYKNCNIYVTVNGKQQHIYTDTKGIFNCNYNPTSAGTQNVTVTYKGNTNYLGDKIIKNFEAN